MCIYSEDLSGVKYSEISCYIFSIQIHNRKIFPQTFPNEEN